MGHWVGVAEVANLAGAGVMPVSGQVQRANELIW